MSRVAFSPKEVGKLLGMNPEGVRRLIREGDIPAFDLGRQKRVPAEWVQSKVKGAMAVDKSRGDACSAAEENGHIA